MRILYDHQTFMYQSIGGMSQYFSQLIRHLPAEFIPVLALDNTKNVSGIELEKYATKLFRRAGKRNRLQRVVDRVRGLDLKKLNADNSMATLLRGEYDVFHPTAYDPYCLDVAVKAPMIITFHDCIHEHWPEYFSLNDNMTTSKNRYLNRADAVICISEYAKAELLRYFECDEKRLYVVPHGVDHELYRSAREEGRSYAEKLGTYVLFIGGRSGYKNWAYWLRALEKSLKRRKEITVICTGREFGLDERNFIEGLGLEGRVKHVSADSSQLPGLYAGARGFFFPSLDEGFGLPTLEAMAAGCPVALSDIPVMREVAADAAIYFNPKDKRSIEAAFEILVGDDRATRELSCIGTARAGSFSWERTARETAAVYEKVLGK